MIEFVHSMQIQTNLLHCVLLILCFGHLLVDFLFIVYSMSRVELNETSGNCFIQNL